MKIQIIDRTITFENKPQDSVEGQAECCSECVETISDVIISEFEGSAEIASGIIDIIDKRSSEMKMTDEGLVMSTNYNWSKGIEKVLLIKILR
jgi:hypothetical protein